MYPELETNPRIYNPDLFDINRVYNYLKNKVWKRKVKKNGQLRFGGIHIYVGIKYVGITVLITFDPIEKLWMVRKKDDTLLKTYDSGVPTEKEIKDFALSSHVKE